MDIQKVAAAHGEMRDCYRLLAVGIQVRNDAEARLLADEPFPSNHDWMEAAKEYAAITAEVYRLQARIGILKGRIHFEAQTVR